MHLSLLSRAAFLPGAFAALASLLLTSTAPAQTGLIQDATILAYSGGPVPDASSVPLPGVTFSAVAPHFSSPAISENGNLLFRGRITPALAGQEYGMFHGSTSANLVLVVRDGDAVPGLPGATIALVNQFPRLSPIGTPDFTASFSGAGVTTANDSAWFGGTPGAPAMLRREGDAAPGTVGAVFGSLLGVPVMNRNGHTANKITLLGGDVSGVTNDEAWYAGLPGALELVLREGTIVQGAAATILGTGLAQMNDSNLFLYQLTLSTTLGPTPATPASDAITLLHTPGSGSIVVAREGDPAPGTAGAAYFGLQQFGPNCFTASGRMAFIHGLTGGDVVGTTNSLGVFVRAGGVNTLGVRAGAPAPGTAGAEFANFNANTLLLQDDGAIAFEATLRNGDVTTANDDAFYAGQPGSLQLIVREGQLAPDTMGSTFGGLNPGPYFRTSSGRIVFANTLVAHGGGSLSGKSWWYFDPITQALLPIWLPGEQFTVAMATETITDLATAGAANNTASASLAYGQDGDLVGVLTFASGATAVIKLRTRAPEPVPYCFGDGSGTPCPCMPVPLVGDADKGCPNSFNAGGGKLTAAGNPSISADTLVMTCTTINNGGAVVFQGTNDNGGGLGSAFGDGLRCAAGTVRRMRSHPVTTNSYQYPNPMFGDNAISIRGAVVAPGDRWYQGWYRSGLAHCNPTQNYNLTNGLKVTWTL